MYYYLKRQVRQLLPELKIKKNQVNQAYIKPPKTEKNIRWAKQIETDFSISALMSKVYKMTLPRRMKSGPIV